MISPVLEQASEVPVVSLKNEWLRLAASNSARMRREKRALPTAITEWGLHIVLQSNCAACPPLLPGVTLTPCQFAGWPSLIFTPPSPNPE